MVALYPIVEGHGEVQAVPILLRRIAGEVFGRYDLHVLSPHRVPRGRMVADPPSALQRAIELGARKIAGAGGSGAVLVLLDADDDCPAVLGPKLVRRIRRPDLRVGVVLAKREYEAWLLAGLHSQTDGSGLVRLPKDPESIRGAKEYLGSAISFPHGTYRETVDQPALTASLNLDAARTVPSFDKLCREVGFIL